MAAPAPNISKDVGDSDVTFSLQGRSANFKSFFFENFCQLL